jgi:hypothetical protein
MNTYIKIIESPLLPDLEALTNGYLAGETNQVHSIQTVVLPGGLGFANIITMFIVS